MKENKPSPFSLASHNLFLALHSILNVNLYQKQKENLKPCMPVRRGNSFSNNKFFKYKILCLYLSCFLKSGATL